LEARYSFSSGNCLEEHRTAKIVADKLESFGIEVETGIAGTGVVGTL